MKYAALVIELFGFVSMWMAALVAGSGADVSAGKLVALAVGGGLLNEWGSRRRQMHMREVLDKLGRAQVKHWIGETQEARADAARARHEAAMYKLAYHKQLAERQEYLRSLMN